MKRNIFPLFKNITRPGKVLLYIALLFFGLLFGAAAGSVALLMFGSDTGAAMRLTNSITQISTFVLPPLLFALLCYRKPLAELGLRLSGSIYITIAGLALMFVSLPFNNMLGTLNESLSLPESMATLENMLRTMEDTASELTEQMLVMNGPSDLIANLIAIALIPAIGEELTFRGLIQTSLCKVFKKDVWGVIVGAIIFSAIHMQFYGFLPRFVLGLFLGFIFLWSKSIWLTSAMHFLNNATIVVLYYINGRYADIDVDTFGSSDSAFVIGVSLLFTVGLLMVAWSNRRVERHDERGHEVR